MGWLGPSRFGNTPRAFSQSAYNACFVPTLKLTGVQNLQIRIEACRVVVRKHNRFPLHLPTLERRVEEGRATLYDVWMNEELDGLFADMDFDVFAKAQPATRCVSAFDM